MNDSPMFQLVLEFDGDTAEHLLHTESVEEELEKSINQGFVDGHDIGGGCVNIFLFCNDAQTCFEEVIGKLTEIKYLPTAAGYRKTGTQDFTRLWPQLDKHPFVLR